MASYIAMMSVKIAADYASLQTDLGRAAHEFDKFAKKAVEVGKVVGQGLAIAAGAASALVKSTIDNMDRLDEAAQRIGISAKSLSTLEYAAKRGAVEADAFEKSLVKLAKSASDTAMETGEAIKGFNHLGIAVKDSSGNLKSTDTLLLEIATEMSKYEDSAQKTAVAVSLFGRSGAELIPLLNMGADGIQKMQERAKELGLEIGNDTAAAAGAFNDLLGDMGAMLEGVGNEMATVLLPVLTNITQAFVDSGTEADKAGNKFEWLAGVVEFLAKAFAVAKGVIEGLVNFMAAAFDTVAALASGAGDVATGMGTAVAAGLKMIQGNTDEASALAEQAAEKVFGAWDKTAGKIQTAWSSALTGVGDAINGVAEAFAQIDKPLEQAAETAEESGKKIMGAFSPDGESPATKLKEEAEQSVEAIELLEGSILDALNEANAFEQSLIGMTSKQRTFAIAFKQAAEYFAKHAKDYKNSAVSLKQYATAAGDAAVRLQEMQAKADALNNIMERFAAKTPMQELADQIGLVEEAIAGAKAGLEEFANVDIGKLEQAAKSMRIEMGQRMLSVTKESLQGIQSLTEEGSRSYAQMQVAIDAVTVAEAVLAVIHQASQGDVYTAIPRMIAMIAAIASLGVSVGNLSGGGGSDSAAARQATQGTGTVLGDPAAKSESIANAVEITADATSALVGINRGMLRALESLEKALGAAGGMLARGAGDVDFGSLAGDMEAPIGSAIGNAIIGWVHGGSQSIIDQGVIIAGATLQEMLNGIVVGAYATIETDGGLFGSDSTDDRLSAVSDEFANQFQLVINSLADTVREGAEALGLLPADIEAAMAAFRVEEIRISLMDLSAEEQQAELEAVFSSIFDGLAGSVVPFIGQFQQVGEGLGETLVRVATEVQVFQEAIGQLGLMVDETDPERFAQIADGLIQAVGGIEDFIEQMNTFVSNFSNDAHQFDIATEAINSAFEQYGLTVPPTRDAMFELMQTLDATTEEGREQIATLLRLSSAAAEYYDMLEKFQFLPGQLMQELGQSGGFAEARHEIEQWERDTVAALNALARARGREAASAQDLANVHAVAAQRVAQLIARLREEAASLAEQLGYITGTDTIESLNAQIESLQNASGDAADAIGQAVDGMREKMNLLLGDLSPFNDQKKLELALEGLRAGTVDPETVLEIGRRLYASTANYTALFNQVMGMANFGGGGGMNPGANQSEDGRTLQELIAARDALLAAQRPDLADDLAHRIAELAAATGDSFAEVAESMGFDLSNIAADLNIGNDQLNELLTQYMEQFEAMDFGSLTETLTSNYTENTDRIVAAIEGKSVADAVANADATMAEQNQATANQQSTEERLTAIETAINSQTSALISAGIANTNSEVGAQQEFNRELREMNLRWFTESERRTPVMIR